MLLTIARLTSAHTGCYWLCVVGVVGWQPFGEKGSGQRRVEFEGRPLPTVRTTRTLSLPPVIGPASLRTQIQSKPIMPTYEIALILRSFKKVSAIASQCETATWPSPCPVSHWLCVCRACAARVNRQASSEQLPWGYPFVQSILQHGTPLVHMRARITMQLYEKGRGMPTHSPITVPSQPHVCATDAV